MESIISAEVSDFFEIHSQNIELISIKNPDLEEIEVLAKEIINSTKELELRWVQDINDLGNIENLLPASLSSDQKNMLINQISKSSKILGMILKCSKFTVRLAKLRSPMCPLFHVDQIPCRLLISLYGNGTEWIENDMVDWEILLDRHNMNVPLKEYGKIRQMSTGNWCFLKGGKWQSNFHGVVHRSPHEISDRLLLSLDPILG